jgi:TAG lipase/steryl ester hydrolase/phospholipase A2/LPA acyltransferase
MNVSIAPAETHQTSHLLNATTSPSVLMRSAVTRATSLMLSIINQDYVGDINILPDYRLIKPTKLLGFPGEKQVKKLIASGERCTWLKLEMIRQQTRISRTLRQILQNYESGVVV